MSEGAKTALIVAGVAVGAFFVVRMVSGSTSTAKPRTAGNPAQAQQGAMFLSGLVTGGLQSLYKAGAFGGTTPVSTTAFDTASGVPVNVAPGQTAQQAVNTIESAPGSASNPIILPNPSAPDDFSNYLY